MKTTRARLGLAVAALALLVVGAWYQQRTMLCDDALARRRADPYGVTPDSAQAAISRYCFTWVP